MSEKSPADYSFEIIFALVLLAVFLFSGCPDIHDAALKHLLGGDYVIKCDAE